MHAQTVTKVPLAEFARIIGIHPLHFAGISWVPDGRSAGICQNVFYQHAWQNSDAVGREMIAEAMAQAERMIEDQLGWRLLPSWEFDEWHTLQSRHTMVRADWGYFISPGVEARDLMGAGRPITWVDNDSDDYAETGFITVTVPLNVDPCELEVYYPDKDGDPRFRIAPLVSVNVTGTVATIKFRRELCLLEELAESLNPSPYTHDDDNNFLQTVDVYRHFNDPRDQGLLMWEPGAKSCNCAASGGCSLCSYTTQTMCVYLHSEPRQSIVHARPAEWDAEAGTMASLDYVSGGMPSHMRLSYYAGHQDKSLDCPRRDMDEQWKRAVVYLACSLLDRPPCDCSVAEWEKWRKETSYSPGADQVAGSAADMKSPFGTLQGAVYAWRRVRDPRQQLGYAVAV